MQIQGAQNNNYNTTFNAALKVKGCLYCVDENTMKLWKNHVKYIGNDKDIVTLTISIPRSKSGDGITKATRNMSVRANAEINGTQQESYESVSAPNTKYLYKLMREKVSEILNKLG